MAQMTKVSVQACLAEFVAMALFVLIGCGTAMSNPSADAWALEVALAFGLAITVLAYAIGHYSGGHINCAVTFGLVLAGECGLLQGLANLFAQLLGSLAGAGILCLIVPEKLGANSLGDRRKWHHAFFGEIVFTCLLMFVVLQTACNKKSEANRSQACIAIGFAVFLAHAVLIPIDGCSINPTRSFGPAAIQSIRYADDQTVISQIWDHMWIFWVAPLLGSAVAVGLYKLMQFAEPRMDSGAMKDEGVVPEASV